jgi:hypothetical protein
MYKDIKYKKKHQRRTKSYKWKFHLQCSFFFFHNISELKKFSELFRDIRKKN